MTTMMMHLIQTMPDSVLTKGVDYNEEKLVAFLYDVQQGYMKEVQYHNDYHGADVAQMVHYAH